MATRLLLPWIWLALLFGYCGASTCGKEFVTAFLKNYLPSQHNVSFELLITGYQPATTVTVTVNKSTFRKTVSVNEKETVSVVVPASSEMRGSNVFDQTVRIQADKEVSVFSVNYKAVTSAATVVYPVGQLGTLYYVVTPAGNHTPQNFKEFAVVANNSPTRVTIHLKGAVTFKGNGYPAGSKLVVDLQAFQAIQLQSSVDLSGTKVESVAPVAVLSGHSCAMQFTTCDHVVEQLLPVSSWGTTFIVPSPLAFQTKFDIVYVIASQNTLIQYHSGATQGSRQAEAGQVIQFQMQPSQPLYFSAGAGIQVLFFYTGAENQNVKHEPFLINIPALTSYCTSYRTGGIRRFANFAVIIAKTSVSCGIRLEKKAITNTEWRPIPGTEYSFAQLPLGRNASPVSVEHPSTPFGLLIFGVSPFIGIGSTALCSCALPCPQNSHYEFCGNGCPASCADRKAPSACKQLCVETCQCNDGYVLSGNKCVPVESCGCTFNGLYYKPGEEFWADETCGYRCTCASTLGRVVCEPADCKASEACTVVNGVRGCHPISTATCSAAGDTHYAP